jgi:RNA polymerase sigma factor (sigma-70 family)
MEASRDDGEAAARRAELTSDAASDAALVARCRTGDAAAWSELVDRFSRYVYAIAVQGFRLSQQDAEDVFQEVFTRVYERLDSLREDEAVRPWIAQLTRRLCIDRLRAGARESDADIDELPELPAEDVLTKLEEAFDVHEAMAELPENCRQILDRFFARDESYRTIGDQLGLPSGTIASRISRCLDKLRDTFEGEGRNLPPAASSGQVT